MISRATSCNYDEDAADMIVKIRTETVILHVNIPADVFLMYVAFLDISPKPAPDICTIK